MRFLSVGALLALAALAATAAPVRASAPQPKKPFDVERMPGHWYEIARTSNSLNRDCQASATDWTASGDGKFKIVAVCRQGSPTGPEKVIKGDVRITDPEAHNKVRMYLFGGLISADYWLLDHAPDYSWLIMGTPNGKFMSIMSPHPVLPAGVRAEVLLDARTMGYDTSKLVFPEQPTRD